MRVRPGSAGRLQPRGAGRRGRRRGRCPATEQPLAARRPRRPPRATLAGVAVGVQGVMGGQEADQDQHDQADPLLAVVRAVRELTPVQVAIRIGADPERRRPVALRAARKLGVAGQVAWQDARSRAAARTNPTSGEIRSERPTSPALPQLTPAPKAWPGRQRVGQAHPQDRADQGVRARRRAGPATTSRGSRGSPRSAAPGPSPVPGPSRP